MTGEVVAALDGRPMFGDPCGPWIKTFAWRPLFTFDGGTVWLRVVWKRHISKHQHLDGGPDYWWQFRRFAPPVLRARTHQAVHAGESS